MCNLETLLFVIGVNVAYISNKPPAFPLTGLVGLWTHVTIGILRFLRLESCSFTIFESLAFMIF